VNKQEQMMRLQRSVRLLVSAWLPAKPVIQIIEWISKLKLTFNTNLANSDRIIKKITSTCLEDLNTHRVEIDQALLAQFSLLSQFSVIIVLTKTLLSMNFKISTNLGELVKVSRV
jgi:hypothetical protein